MPKNFKDGNFAMAELARPSLRADEKQSINAHDDVERCATTGDSPTDLDRPQKGNRDREGDVHGSRRWDNRIGSPRRDRHSRRDRGDRRRSRRSRSRTRSRSRERRRRNRSRSRDRRRRSYSRSRSRDRRRRYRSPSTSSRSRSPRPPLELLRVDAPAPAPMPTCLPLNSQALLSTSPFPNLVLPPNAAPNPATRSLRRLYVGGIPNPCFDFQLTEFLNSTLLALGLVSATGGPPILKCEITPGRNYAFIEFGDVANTTSCMQLDGIIYNGNPLRIKRPKDYVMPYGVSQCCALCNPLTESACDGLLLCDN